MRDEMKKIRQRLASPLLLLCTVPLFCLFPVEGFCESTDIPELAPDFAARAFTHVENLVALGKREAGTPIEARARAYIADQFVAAGLDVEIEPFSFYTYSLDRATVTIGDRQLTCTFLLFDPFDGFRNQTGAVVRTLSAAAVLVDPNISNSDLLQLELAGKLVITAEPAHRILVSLLQPLAIAYVDPTDLIDLEDPGEKEVLVEATGRYLQHESANVIGTLSPAHSTDRHLILSAHLDSYNGPGADDNGSGIGTLIELARHFSMRREELPCPLKFIAYGAEELGMLGARAYVEAHGRELQSCELVFNIDSVGGDREIYMAMRGGIRNVSPEKGVNPFPAYLRDKGMVDLVGNWLLLHPALWQDISNIPDWLHQTVLDSIEELNYEIVEAGTMGSDYTVFAAAGIPATNISISGDSPSHVPEDTPEKVHPAGLEKAGRIAARVVERALSRIDPPTPILTTYLDFQPRTFSLLPNYPNPFNAGTTIRFTLPRTSAVRLTVYDLTGQIVSYLVDGTRTAGTHLIHWDGRDDRGNSLASGPYLYRLQADSRSRTRQMLLLK